jgi:hypothetical protein
MEETRNQECLYQACHLSVKNMFLILDPLLAQHCIHSPDPVNRTMFRVCDWNKITIHRQEGYLFSIRVITSIILINKELNNFCMVLYSL